MRTARHLLSAAILSLLAIASTTALRAQEDATLRGRVATPEGAPLPGARIDAVLLSDTTVQQGTHTDTAGRYEIRLPAGAYRVGVGAIGYSSTADTVTLTPGQDAVRDFLLCPLTELVLEPVVSFVSSRAFNLSEANYFLAGPENLRGGNPLQPGEYGNQVKFRVAIRYQIFGVQDPDYHSGFYAGYRQNSFWHLYEPSGPFFDNNYNPQLFAYFDSRNIDPTSPWIPSVRMMLEHESNGRDGPETRSWDRATAGLHFGHPDQHVAYGYVSAWKPFRIEAENHDIRETNGRGEIGITLQPWIANRLSAGAAGLNVKARILGEDPIVNTEVNVFVDPALLRIPALMPSLMVQLFYGTGENLLSHRERHFAVRFGLATIR